MSGPFYSARDLQARAAVVLERERERLRGTVGGTLELTGGSSVPGALTGGDIDLHLRVPPGAFTAAVAALPSRYRVVHPEIWCDTLATFELAEDERVGIAVTPIGSHHDGRFVTAWRVLRDDPSVLEAYNAMKRARTGREDAEYLSAKAAFFDDLERRGGEGDADSARHMQRWCTWTISAPSSATATCCRRHPPKTSSERTKRRSSACRRSNVPPC